MIDRASPSRRLNTLPPAIFDGRRPLARGTPARSTGNRPPPSETWQQPHKSALVTTHRHRARSSLLPLVALAFEQQPHSLYEWLASSALLLVLVGPMLRDLITAWRTRPQLQRGGHHTSKPRRPRRGQLDHQEHRRGARTGKSRRAE